MIINREKMNKIKQFFDNNTVKMILGVLLVLGITAFAFVFGGFQASEIEGNPVDGIVGKILAFRFVITIIQVAVTVGAIIFLGVSIFNAFNGQQVDLTAIFKTIIMVLVGLAILWFGPNLIFNSFKGDAMKEKETKTSTFILDKMVK